MAQQGRNYPSDYTKGPERAEKIRLQELSESAGDHLKDAADNVQETAGKIAEQARVYGEKAQDMAQNVKPFVEKSMKDQPMGTLAVAALVGFALGALWKK